MTFLPPSPLGAVFALVQASSEAAGVDAAAWALLAASALLLALLFGLNFYFIVRYRRGSRAPRRPSRIPEWKVEAAWIAATTAIFLGFFGWGARLYVRMHTVPAGATVINVIGRQWMWDIRQPNGRREFNTLHVPVGTPILLRLTSEDVIHSFFVPSFRLKQDVVPGKEVTLWFTGTRAGEFPLFCSEYCGSKHAAMVGTIIVQEPEVYAAWLGGALPAELPAAAGRRLFVRYGCSGCHDSGAAVHAPGLAGLYGQRVPLAAGGFARVDDAYLRDCILEPTKAPPAGYALIMPSFRGVIPEGDLIDLIGYLKSLSPAP